MTYRLGVDVGGTFTDVVLYDSDAQRVWLAKTPSTPHDQSEGVIEGIRLAAERASVGLPDLDAILHGTTVATNAVLERRGALCGLIVTRGFRHILHLADVARIGQRLRLLVHHEPEQRPRRPGLGEVEDVPEALRHNQAAERPAALEDGVGGDGRAVEDRVEIGKADARAVGDEADPVDHADRLVERRARRLRQPDPLGRAVVKNDVRERAADVDSEAVRHAISLASAAASRYFSTRTSQLRAWPSKFSTRH